MYTLLSSARHLSFIAHAHRSITPLSYYCTPSVHANAPTIQHLSAGRWAKHTPHRPHTIQPRVAKEQQQQVTTWRAINDSALQRLATARRTGWGTRGSRPRRPSTRHCCFRQLCCTRPQCSRHHSSFSSSLATLGRQRGHIFAPAQDMHTVPVAFGLCAQLGQLVSAGPPPPDLMRRPTWTPSTCALTPIPLVTPLPATTRCTLSGRRPPVQCLSVSCHSPIRIWLLTQLEVAAISVGRMLCSTTLTFRLGGNYLSLPSHSRQLQSTTPAPAIKPVALRGAGGGGCRTRR